MHVEAAGATTFTVNFTKYELVGFHATSAAASDIERVGLLPHKFFDYDTHLFLLDLARQVEIETGAWGGYEEWLRIMSVTLTKNEEEALLTPFQAMQAGKA